MSGALDYLFVINLFNRGGAEVETLHMIQALQALCPSAKIGLLTTLDRPSEWLRRLPKNITVLEFGRKYPRMTNARRRTRLGEFLLRTRPRVIHVVGSQLGWDVYRTHGARLAKQSILVGTSFGAENFPRGPFGYAQAAIRKSKKHIRLILSDNATHVREIRKTLGFKRVRPLFAPVTLHHVKPRRITGTRKLKILWASRWDAQKRMDILYLVALFNPKQEFHVYGGIIGEPGSLLIDIGKLGSLENVTIHGPFNGNEEIPFHRFDLFLYTSVWDGLPNILLEASAHGLPILAPDVGGVRELIDANTGFLVSKSHAVREYLDGIELVRRNPRLAQSRAKAAQKILRRRHSWKEFQKNYRQILKTIGFAP